VNELPNSCHVEQCVLPRRVSREGPIEYTSIVIRTLARQFGVLLVDGVVVAVGMLLMLRIDEQAPKSWQPEPPVIPMAFVSTVSEAEWSMAQWPATVQSTMGEQISFEIPVILRSHQALWLWVRGMCAESAMVNGVPADVSHCIPGQGTLMHISPDMQVTGTNILSFTGHVILQDGQVVARRIAGVEILFAERLSADGQWIVSLLPSREENPDAARLIALRLGVFAPRDARALLHFEQDILERATVNGKAISEVPSACAFRDCTIDPMPYLQPDTVNLLEVTIRGIDQPPQFNASTTEHEMFSPRRLAKLVVFGLLCLYCYCIARRLGRDWQPARA